MRPYLKWPGGKHRLAPTIASHMPAANRLIEPFVGSGSVFLCTNYPYYLLADSNSRLIRCHLAVSSRLAEVEQSVRELFTPAYNQADQYYEQRAAFNLRPTDDVENAALLIYLNRHAFNGLYRENQAGAFNAPFGQYDKPYYPQAELQGFAAQAAGARFIHQDFRLTMNMAGEGDVIYCDPPYVPLSISANFTGYSGAFGASDQEDLANLADQARQRGATVLISNHDLPVTRTLYAAASEIISLQVSRTISRNGAGRKKVAELLAIYRP